MIQYFPVRFKAEPLSKLYPGTVPHSLLIYLWEFILAVFTGCFEMDYFIGRCSGSKAERGFLKIRKMQIFLEQKNIPRRIPWGLRKKNLPARFVKISRAGFLFSVNIDILGAQLGIHNFLAAVKPIIAGKHETDTAGNGEQHQPLGAEQLDTQYY